MSTILDKIKECVNPYDLLYMLEDIIQHIESWAGIKQSRPHQSTRLVCCLCVDLGFSCDIPLCCPGTVLEWNPGYAHIPPPVAKLGSLLC
jgi:hypothetical protein